MTISEKKEIPEQAQDPEQALSDTSLDGVTGGASAGAAGEIDFDPSQFEKIETLNPGESVPVVTKKP